MANLKRAVIVALLCGVLNPAYGQNAVAERESALIAVLMSNAETMQKADACRELALVGSANAVPALAALLGHEDLAHMARYGLEAIPGPAVEEALREALGRLKGRLLVGVIGSIGARRDDKAVSALAGLVKDVEADVAQASARALGSIGTEDAAQHLLGALPGAPAANRLALYEGLFRCAERLGANGRDAMAIAIYDALRTLEQTPHQVQAGAWRGAIVMRRQEGLPLLLQALRSTDPGLATAALRIAIETKEAGVSRLLADELGTVPAARQIQLCNVLGKRGDVEALPALLELSKSGDKAARIAAIGAAVEIGNAGAAMPLIELLKDPDADVAQAAAAGLAGLPGAEVDAAAIRMLSSPDPALKLKILDLVRRRRIVTALPLLLKFGDDENESVRSAAIGCYAELGGEAELAGLLERIVKDARADEIGAIERALVAICGGATDPRAYVPMLIEALSKAGPEAKPTLLKTLGVAGGPEALQAVRLAVDDANTSVHTAAIRTLGAWKTGDAASTLLELAKHSGAEVDRILSLRGYLGMAMRTELSTNERLAICRESAPLIRRDEEKRLLLGALGSIASIESLSAIVPYLDDPGVRGEAVASVLAIAEKRKDKKHVGLAREALEKVVKVAEDNPSAVKRASELLTQMEREQP